MKIYTILSVISLVLIFTTFNGCIDDISGNIKIQGKGYFNSIQKAIDAASSHDTILVYQSIYNETLTINKSIKLIAVDKEPTIIQYNNNDTAMSLIEINANNCTIDGFIIISNDKTLNSNGIKVLANDIIIKNNTIQNFYNGIYLDDANNNILSHNIIVKNDIGLFTTYSLENEFNSNNISMNGMYGIYTSSQTDSNVFQNNLISRNNIGLRVKGSRNNIFKENIVENNVDKGFYICCGSRNNIVYNNSIINNNLNADDHYNNQWDYRGFGNYWDDFLDKYPLSVDENNDGIWDTPYTIYEDTVDTFPLSQPKTLSSINQL
ncbi:MAG: right-handed parallel beta-helix repeat-containing protein [Thermoplasmatales archaeon]|nr:right-handed parallel beta-helix repeat-containing protein [Thermoplasmatales archaeon]